MRRKRGRYCYVGGDIQRVHNTLSSIFHLEDKKKQKKKEHDIIHIQRDNNLWRITFLGYMEKAVEKQSAREKRTRFSFWFLYVCGMHCF